MWNVYQTRRMQLIQDLGKASEVLDTLFNSNPIQKVLFIQPPDTPPELFDFETCRRKCYPHYPPYGHMVLAGNIRKMHCDPKILDINSILFSHCISCIDIKEFNYKDCVEGAIYESIKSFQPDLIAVGCMFSYSHNSFKNIVEYIKNSFGSIPIAVGGVHVTNSVSSTETSDVFFRDLKSANIISLYEGDKSFCDLIRAVNGEIGIGDLTQTIITLNGSDYFNFPGRTPPAAEDMRTLPAFDLIEIDKYSSKGSIGNFYYLKKDFRVASTTLSNRGCRAQCTFCSVRSFNGVGVRRKDIDTVVEELKILRYEHGVDHIMWLDDDFLFNHKASIELFNEMIKQNVGLTWDCSNGVLAASCKDEIISAAVDSGCIGLQIGIESGNKDILLQVRKPATVEVYIEAAKVLKNYPELYTRVFLMLGFVGETYSQIKDTIDLCSETGFDWHSINILEPLPNTSMWRDMQKEDPAKIIDFESIQYITNPVKFKGSGQSTSSKKDSEVSNNSSMALDFARIFEAVNLNSVPTRENQVKIRAYMDYMLNFAPILKENRLEKLNLKERHLKHIIDVVAPQNAIAMWYLCFVQKRLYGHAPINTLESLDILLKSSQVWRDQFSNFGLKYQSLINMS